MAVFTLPLPTVLSTGGGGATNVLTGAQSSIQLDPNGNNGTILIKTNNKEAIAIDGSQRSRFGGSYTSAYQLSISESNGACLELVHNKSFVRSSFDLTPTGELNITTYGNVIRLPRNVRIDYHDGDSYGLILGGILVRASADQLNYTKIQSVGTAEPLKALVTDINRNIGNIGILTTDEIFGTVRTSNQPHINQVNILNIQNHNGDTFGLSLGGVLVKSTAAELNYLNITPGTTAANKAVVLNASKEVSGINMFQANYIAGRLTDPNQPNITGVGTLQNLSVTGTMAINKPASGYALDINHVSGSCLRLSRFSTSENHMVMFSLSSNGSLNITPSGPEINIASGKKIGFVDNGGEIYGLSKITSTSIIGTLETPIQPNITQIGTLSSLLVHGNIGVGTTIPRRRIEIDDPSGNCLRLTYNGVSGVTDKYVDFSVNSMGQLNITPSNPVISLPINCQLQFNANGSITGLNTVSASSITGTLLTSAQPNITSIGRLTALNMSGNINDVNNVYATFLHGRIMTGNQPNITSLGTLSNLVVTGTLTGVTSLTSSEIYGTIKTNSQPHITSLGTLTSLNMNGPITGVTVLSVTSLQGTLLTSNQPNITSIGTLTGLSVNGNITSSGNITGSSLYGTIQTASQPNITQVGALANLVVTGNITGVTSIIASQLQGTLTTPIQPNITSIGTLTNLVVTGNITGVNTIIASQLQGTLTTNAQPNITSVGTLQNLRTDGFVGISCTDPSRSLEVNHVDGDCLRLSRNAPTGSAVQYVDFSVNASGDLVLVSSSSTIRLGEDHDLTMDGGSITGINTISASSISGTLNTSAQPNITSIGRLSSLFVDGKLGINCTSNPNRALEIRQTQGECLRLMHSTQSVSCDFDISSSGDLLIDLSGDTIHITNETTLSIPQGSIENLLSIQSTYITGTILTPTQSNITKVGTLLDLQVSGKVGINTSPSTAALDINDINGSCLIMRHDALGNITPAYTSFAISSAGNLQIFTSGSSIDIYNEKDLHFVNGGSILGVDNVHASSIYGTLMTNVQPNITSIGTLNTLRVDGSVGIQTTTPSRQLEVNHITGQCLRLSHNAPFGGASNYCDFIVSSSGDLLIQPSSNVVSYSANTNVELSGTSKITAPRMILGNTVRNTMPLEVGIVPFNMSSAYAYNNNVNGHGIVSAGSTAVYNYSIRTDGRILCTGSVDVTSDVRLKKNIKPVDPSYCERFIKTTKPVTFHWKKGETHTVFGYIAQELLKSGFGELVNVAGEEGLEEFIDEDNFISPKDVKFTITYEKIIPILACNQKKIMKENEQLRKELNELKDIIKSNLNINI